MSFEFKYTYIQDISCCIPKTTAKSNKGGDYMKGTTSFYVLHGAQKALTLYLMKPLSFNQPTIQSLNQSIDHFSP